MNNTNISRIATASVIVLSALAIALRTRPARDAASTADPQSTIYATVDAARNGNVQLYLAHFTGSFEATLRQTVAESTEPKFAAYLKESIGGLKGIAVAEPQSLDDRGVKARVEFIYQDRTVAQTMYLAKGEKDWKISRIDDQEQVKTPFPYGTRIH